jgi:predicted DNA-binding transcriptional regulator AlpA
MLLTTKDAAALVGLSEPVAKDLFKEVGVLPLDLGGRRGLRWYQEEILQALESKRRGNTAPVRPKTKKIPDAWNLPVAEIMKELLPGQHERKEKTGQKPMARVLA